MNPIDLAAEAESACPRCGRRVAADEFVVLDGGTAYHALCHAELPTPANPGKDAT